MTQLKMSTLAIPLPNPLTPIHRGLLPVSEAFPLPPEEPPDKDEAIRTREAHRIRSQLKTQVEGMESMKRCPKFSACSAPICPLDPHWSHRDMKNGESACTWILEMAKGGLQSTYVPESIRQDIAAVVPDLVPSLGLAPLRVAIKAAQKTGSRRAPSRFAHLQLKNESQQ